MFCAGLSVVCIQQVHSCCKQWSTSLQWVWNMHTPLTMGFLCCWEMGGFNKKFPLHLNVLCWLECCMHTTSAFMLKTMVYKLAMGVEYAHPPHYGIFVLLGNGGI